MIPISDPDLQRRSRPYVNIALISITGLIFLYELALGPTERSLFFYRYGLIAREITEGISFEVIRADGGALLDIESPIPTWGTVFTSMFIHADFFHFAFNMLFLWVFGDNIEDRMGHLKYLLLYLGGGLAATWTQIAIFPNAEVPLIGASGAIAAVLGAYLLLYPLSKIRTMIFFFFITFVRIPAALLLGFWLLLQFVSGIGDLGPSAQSGGTAYWAHIGGFGAGLLAAVAFKVLLWKEPLWPRRRGPPKYWPWEDDPRFQ